MTTTYPPEVGQLLAWLEANEGADWDAIPADLRPWQAVTKQDGLTFGGTSKTVPTLTDLGRCALIEHQRRGAGERPATAKPGKPDNKGKNVNARMLAKLHKDATDGTNESAGWTCKQWAGWLKCSTSSVVMAPAWIDLQPKREKAKAERALDRRGRGTGRRREVR